MCYIKIVTYSRFNCQHLYVSYCSRVKFVVKMLIVILVLITIITIAFYWFKSVSHWDKYLKRYPGPTTVPFFGNALEIRKTTDIIPKLLEYQEKYGGIYKLQIGPKRNLVLSDYKIVEFLLKSNTLINKSDIYRFIGNWIGDGLLTSTGEKWKQHRKILTPAFHFNILEQYMHTFNSASDILIKKLYKLVDKEAFDIYPIISLYILDIICESAMSTPVNAQKNSDSDYIKYVSEMERILVERMFSAVKIFDFLYWFTEDYRIEQKALKVLHSFSNLVIKKRKEKLLKSTEKFNIDDTGRKRRLAFLDVLLSATIDGKSMPDEDIRAEVDTFVFEGHDTVSSAISFAIYCLSMHQEIQSKVVDELKMIFGDDINRHATYQELQDMKYLELVLKEAMRVYPPIVFFARELEEDVEYDGATLPRGLTLIVFAYGIHKNPEFYPEPDKFDPDRFLPENLDGKNPFNYIPFSAGPRNCIGQKFAMLEVKSTLSKILRHFEILSTVPEHKVVLAADGITKSANGILIRLKKRKF